MSTQAWLPAEHSHPVRVFRTWRRAVGEVKKETRVRGKKKKKRSHATRNIFAVGGNADIILASNGSANFGATPPATGNQLTLHRSEDGRRSSAHSSAQPIANCGEARAGCRLSRRAPRLPQIRERAARSLSLVLVRTSWSAPWRLWFPMAPSPAALRNPCRSLARKTCNRAAAPRACSVLGSFAVGARAWCSADETKIRLVRAPFFVQHRMRTSGN